MSSTITFRVDAAEHAEIAARAARDKISLSDYVRVRLGLRAKGSVDGSDEAVLADEGAVRAQLRRARPAPGRPRGPRRGHAELGATMDEAEIRTLVGRLARPHPSGGKVIERAAILAAGAGSDEVVDWIVRRAALAETASAGGRSGGLHGGRLGGAGRSDDPPLRYILPAGALD